ncbi:MAG TPA: ADP-ribosylglycohydrolase family protein [Bryobacteraceae bacterium]|nr:ADP-ribosylglycohydrolase family protein [Bryobacteraceae bacterium]
MDRRQFLHRSILPVVACAAPGSAMPSLDESAEGVGQVGLKDKFFGCIAGCHVGSALKGPCEGWTWQDCEAKFGMIDKMLPYRDYGNNWNREPGTTEDGVERQKMMITAIIEKQDRVTAEDVRKIWVRDMKPEAAGMISEPFEAVLLAMAKSNIPAADIGKYCDYAGLVSMSRSCHPIPLINAGDVDSAVNDVMEVGQLYQTANSRGLQWAAIMAIAIATATKPGATVDSVIGAVLKGHPRIGRGTTSEIERGLRVAQPCKDYKELRVAFDKVYFGKGMPYPTSYANEVVTKAICVFSMVKGNTKEAMLAAVNMGRDTDCMSACAAGISGALTGASSIPEEWIRQVDYATTKMPITNSKRTVREHADGLYGAFLARLRRIRTYADEMEKA